MTDFVIPDSITPIEGWRVWLHTPDGDLSALHSGEIWPRRQAIQAQCRARRYSLFPWSTVEGGHGTPDPTQACKCGIHAHDNPTAAVKRSNLVSHIVGRVALWGVVVECEFGYRAEYGYPLELWVPYGRRGEWVERLADAYGVTTHRGKP